MSETPLPEPLENFLQTPPALPPPGGMRESLLQRTSVMLPEPRWRRRLEILAAMAAGILLAILYTYIALGPPNVEPPFQKDLVERKKDALPEEKPKAPAPEQLKTPALVKAVDPLDLEWNAFDAADDRDKVRLYFQAGNLYLDKTQDYESAVRCYHQALHFSEAREREIDINDNWLVMALKRDRRKEQ